MFSAPGVLGWTPPGWTYLLRASRTELLQESQALTGD